MPAPPCPRPTPRPPAQASPAVDVGGPVQQHVELLAAAGVVCELLEAPGHCAVEGTQVGLPSREAVGRISGVHLPLHLLQVAANQSTELGQEPSQIGGRVGRPQGLPGTRLLHGVLPVLALLLKAELNSPRGGRPPLFLDIPALDGGEASLEGAGQGHRGLIEALQPAGKAVGGALLLMLLRLSGFSRVRLCATPETAAHKAPLPLGFSRQEHWSGLPFPSPWFYI